MNSIIDSPLAIIDFTRMVIRLKKIPNDEYNNRSPTLYEWISFIEEEEDQERVIENNGKMILELENDIEILPENICFNPYNEYRYHFKELVVLPGSKLKKIDAKSFLNNRIEKVFLDESNIEIIEPETFLQCKLLEDVFLPDTLKQISNLAFCGCVSLKTINFPNGLEEIGEASFYNTINLHNINLPASLNKLGNGCFMVLLDNRVGEKNLRTHITITDNITDIGDNCFFRAIDRGNRTVCETTIDMGTLTPGNDDFPNSSDSLIQCRRYCHINFPMGNHGSCLLRKKWRENEEGISNDITLINHNIHSPLLFSIPEQREIKKSNNKLSNKFSIKNIPTEQEYREAVMNGSIQERRELSRNYMESSLSLNIIGLPLEQELKEELVNQYPELGETYSFDLLLHSDTTVRISLNLREVLEEAIIGNLNLNVPITIQFNDLLSSPEENIPLSSIIGTVPLRQPIRSPSSHPLFANRSLIDTERRLGIQFTGNPRPHSFIYNPPRTIQRENRIHQPPLPPLTLLPGQTHTRSQRPAGFGKRGRKSKKDRRKKKGKRSKK